MPGTGDREMVKRRERAAQPVDTDKEIEAFAAHAENTPLQTSSLPKDAKRDFKAIRVPFNEY